MVQVTIKLQLLLTQPQLLLMSHQQLFINQAQPVLKGPLVLPATGLQAWLALLVLLDLPPTGWQVNLVRQGTQALLAQLDLLVKVSLVVLVLLALPALLVLKAHLPMLNQVTRVPLVNPVLKVPLVPLVNPGLIPMVLKALPVLPVLLVLLVTTVPPAPEVNQVLQVLQVAPSPAHSERLLFLFRPQMHQSRAVM